MIDSTNPRIMADNIRHLSGEFGSQASDISTLQTTVTAHGNSIGALQNYDDTETDTGKKWIDGLSIYRKCFLISEGLPNNTTSTFAHGISNLDVILSVDAILTSSSDMRPLNYGSNYIRFNSASIFVQSNADISANSLYITIEYTKSAAPSPDLVPAPDDTRSIEPEIREEAPEAEPAIDEPIEEPVKKTTRKKTTTTE